MSDLNNGRDLRSFVAGREPSIDRRFRPRPQENQIRILFPNGIDEEQDSEELESIENDENSNPSISGSSAYTADADEAGALVYLRFRPTQDDATFKTRGNVLIVGPSNEPNKANKTTTNVEKQYVFTDIFHRDIPQADVYKNCVGMKIDSEESFTLLTYGTSGSGKTYTLLGSETEPGIIPRSLEHIFSLYEKKIYPSPSVKLSNGRITIVEDHEMYTHMALSANLLKECPAAGSMDAMRQLIRSEHDFVDEADEDISVFVWINFVEIYNENCYDLLAARPVMAANMMQAPARPTLKIIGSDGNAFVKQLNSVYVKNSVEALHLLKYGLQHVNYAATAINSNSSRSHCIFTIDVLKYYRNGDRSHISYRFCDLAGSERLHKTGNVGSRLKEAQRINTSLLVLGRCIDAANSNSGSRKKTSEIVPYRESKLTMLLQSALLGKEKLSMIVNIMPTDKYYEENINVLGFASIAKNIVFKHTGGNKTQKSRCSFLVDFPQMSAAENEEQMALLKENIFLRSEVGRLTDLLESVKAEHADEMSRFETNLREKLAKKHDALTQAQIKVTENRFEIELARKLSQWEEKYESMKTKYEWKIEDLQEELDALKNNKAKKRRTENSTAIDADDDNNNAQAKRVALDVESVELLEKFDNGDDDDVSSKEANEAKASSDAAEEAVDQLVSTATDESDADTSSMLPHIELNVQHAEHIEKVNDECVDETSVDETGAVEEIVNTDESADAVEL